MALRERAAPAVVARRPGPATARVARQTGMVAVVVCEPSDRLFADPFYARVLHGIATGLTGPGLQQVLLMMNTAEQRRTAERYLTARHVDGVLLLTQRGGDPMPRILDSIGVPHVLGGRPVVDGGWAGSFVDFDNVGGAYAATDHLIRRGYRKVATITGPLDTGAALHRLAGYRQCVNDAGLEHNLGWIVEGDFTAESGAQAMAHLLDTAPPFDAVFVASGTMAVGALGVLHERGIRIPADIAVIGFDDAELADGTDPALTTVRQDDAAMGREMARILVSQLDGTTTRPTRLVLRTELIVRSST